MNVSNRSATSRKGFTATELLICISVVSLLLAILLPAIARARESARLVQCRNNLHQIGVALHSMVESTGAFPTANHVSDLYQPSQPYGIFERLLPALEAEFALEARINYRGARVPAFLCPNDEEADRATAASIPYCYRPNTGSSFRRYGLTGFLKSPIVDTTAGEITDGLSNTTAFSERLWTYSDFPKAGSLRLFWWTSQRFYGEHEVTEAIDQAMRHRVSVKPQAIRADYGDYDHMLTPNSPSSFNGPDAPGVKADFFLIPATSLHDGLVQTLLADGSCRAISNSIDLNVWHALGTRSSGEAVAE